MQIIIHTIAAQLFNKLKNAHAFYTAMSPEDNFLPL